MWSVSNLKLRAKGVLKIHYGSAFAACFLIALIAGGLSGALQVVSEAIVLLRDFDWAFMLLVVTSLLCVILYCFVLSPLEVGGCKYFLRLRYQQVNLSGLFSPFSQGYGNIVEAQFLRWLFLFFWQLPLISLLIFSYWGSLYISNGQMSALIVAPAILSIYKNIAYSMVPYLIAENPKLGARRALALSRKMMRGEKLHVIGFWLSFIGWEILCLITCGLGMLFFTPYINAASAELYAALRDKALYYEWVTQEELPGLPQ